MMETRGILTLCINCQQNRNPRCTKCANNPFNTSNNKNLMTSNSRFNQQSKDLYLRQLDDSQISHMGAAPNILDDRNNFDVNTRDNQNMSYEESAKNDILFSRIITSSSENINKLDDYKTKKKKKATNTRLDFGLYTEPSLNTSSIKTTSFGNNAIPNQLPVHDQRNNSSFQNNFEFQGNSGFQNNNSNDDFLKEYFNGSTITNKMPQNTPQGGNAPQNMFQNNMSQNNIPQSLPLRNNQNMQENKNNDSSDYRTMDQVIQNNSIAISQLINVFSVNIMSAYYKVLTKKKIIFSPYLLFNFLYAFLKGSYAETEKEIEDMLLFENINKNEIFNSVIDVYKLVTSSPYITTANVLVSNIDIPIRSAYYKLVSNILSLTMINTKLFNNEMNNVNINFRKIMKGTISDIITPTTFSKLDPKEFDMAVVQAMHFSAPWKCGFDEKNTRKEFFLQKNSNHIIVEMMNMFNSKHYFVQCNNQQLVEMEFVDDNYRFGCYLKNNIEDDELVDYDNLSLMISKLQKVIIKTLKIPKFTQGSKFFIDEMYKKILPSNTIFTNANIPYITTAKNLSINRIIQYTILTINEKGRIDNTMFKDTLNISFSANRPFTYYVRHVLTNTFILMGIYE